jgi:hypothetical protein
MKMQKKTEEKEISVIRVERAHVTFCLLGKTPLIYHRMAQKASRELLLPSKRKTTADKAASLKHDPIAEYRDSMHRVDDPKSPTLLVMPSPAFKGAMAGATLDMPGGASKAAIGRLTFVQGEVVDIYGVPQVLATIVRMKDIGKTPDVRTRAILPEWACRITVSYVRPVLSEETVANLIAGAGMMQGIGDWRVEKGKGNYGQFEIVEDDNPQFVALLKQGRKQQEDAVRTPQAYNSETAELLTWFTEEVRKRGFRETA